jgi:2-(1,2-epoxy-1,2-dihydrophenyl)acetyl-CoA isomerase
LARESKPLIAAINGVAVGWGLTMSLCCDVRIASEQARLSARFLRAGVTPELGSSTLLPRIVGWGRAMEMIQTARLYNAQEARALGVVSRVVPRAPAGRGGVTGRGNCSTRQKGWRRSSG